jgi:hypothetical protein
MPLAALWFYTWLTVCCVRADAECCQLVLYLVTRQLLKLVHNHTHLQPAVKGGMADLRSGKIDLTLLQQAEDAQTAP